VKKKKGKLVLRNMYARVRDMCDANRLKLVFIEDRLKYSLKVS